MRTTVDPRRHLAPGDAVTVVGLGKMGLPMARNLRRSGFTVLGIDVREESRARARDEGIEVVATPAAAAARSAMTLVVVGFDDQVRDTFSGDGGLLSAAAAGHIVAVCSSVEPRTVMEVAQRAAATAVDVLDTPVARGEPAAEDASLLILCGGPDAVVDRAEPVLRAIGSDLHRLGPVGTGQVGKMLNNYLLWTAVVANRETMRLGARLGVDLDALREVLVASSGNNWALETWTRSRPMPWAEEDMRVVLQYAADVGLPLPLAGLVGAQIAAIKVEKAAWTEGGGAVSSMDAYVRGHL